MCALKHGKTTFGGQLLLRFTKEINNVSKCSMDVKFMQLLFFLIHLWKSAGAYLNVYFCKLKNCTLVRGAGMSNI